MFYRSARTCFVATYAFALAKNYAGGRWPWPKTTLVDDGSAMLWTRIYKNQSNHGRMAIKHEKNLLLHSTNRPLLANLATYALALAKSSADTLALAKNSAGGRWIGYVMDSKL